MRRTELAVVLVCVACRGGSEGGGCRGGAGDGAGADLALTDENNYTYEAQFNFGEVEIAANQDACIDWSQLTTDIRDRPMDPAVTEQLLFVEFRLTQDEVLDLILSNSIDQSDAANTWQWNNSGATSVCLDENFNIIGNYFDADTMLPEDSATTWILTLTNLPNNAYDILTSKFVVPRNDATNTDIVFTDECTTIAVQADLHSHPTLPTQEGIGPYTLDWGDLEKDVNGADWDPLVGDNLIVAHYDVADVSEIEAEFVRLDVTATEYYQLDVFGRTEADLADAVDAAGNTFQGFTTDGVWLVGLSCKTCISPLPLAVAVVDVAPAEK